MPDAVAGAFEWRGSPVPIAGRRDNGPFATILFPPEYDVTLDLTLQFRRKHFGTLAVGNDGGTFDHGMMIAVVNSGAVRTLERSHSGVEGNADEVADGRHCSDRVPHQVVILQLVNGGAATYQPVRLLLHSLITEQSPEVHSPPREPGRLPRRPHNASANVRRIAPDHDELCIGKPARELVHTVIVVRRLASPDRRAFLARI